MNKMDRRHNRKVDEITNDHMAVCHLRKKKSFYPQKGKGIAWPFAEYNAQLNAAILCTLEIAAAWGHVCLLLQKQQKNKMKILIAGGHPVPEEKCQIAEQYA